MNPYNFASMIDHTLLKAEATAPQIEALCHEAIRFKFFAVCVNPVWVSLASSTLTGSSVKIATVAGFPLGASTSFIKAKEAEWAVKQGASEVDMVIPLGAAKAHNWSLIQSDVAEVRKAISGFTLKVILETSALSTTEIEEAGKAALDAGADFLKTSTGFGSGGATVETVKILKKLVTPKSRFIKASGGIRDVATALQMIQAGADRLGTSASVALIQALSQEST
jgi:deoxyribose-phosphate aldolase